MRTEYEKKRERAETLKAILQETLSHDAVLTAEEIRNRAAKRPLYNWQLEYLDTQRADESAMAQNRDQIVARFNWTDWLLGLDNHVKIVVEFDARKLTIWETGTKI